MNQQSDVRRGYFEGAVGVAECFVVGAEVLVVWPVNVSRLILLPRLPHIPWSIKMVLL